LAFEAEELPPVFEAEALGPAFEVEQQPRAMEDWRSRLLGRI
jgi:hypothetical protein